MANGESIATTPGHPSATTQHGNFVFAGDLLLKTPLQEFGDHTVRLASETQHSGPTPIFNFEVEDWHTYFVGKSKLWVHNASTRPTSVDDVTDLHDNYDWPKWKHGGEDHVNKIVETAEDEINSGHVVQLNKGIAGFTNLRPDVMVWKAGTTDFTDLDNLEKIIEVVDTHEDTAAKIAVYAQLARRGIIIETVSVG